MLYQTALTFYPFLFCVIVSDLVCDLWKYWLHDNMPHSGLQAELHWTESVCISVTLPHLLMELLVYEDPESFSSPGD